MPTIKMFMDGDNSWPDLKDKLGTDQLIHLGNDAKPIQMALLDQGMQSGRPSVSIRFDLPDGKTVVAETSLRLLVSTARAFASRYPDLFVGD